MSYRFMRVLVFFDLPVETAVERREYTKFRRFLIKNGFVMMQESVYSKLTLNATAAAAVRANVVKYRPLTGLVQLMTITERQFSNIEFITGRHQSEILDNDERLVVL